LINRRFILMMISVSVVCGILPAGAAVKVTPVANLSILGGQYWVTESVPSSFGGNADIFFSPVLNFSPAVALLPIYSGNYRGTKSVRDLVGGGTLTQESQDHSVSLKLVNKISGNLKLKASANYKLEYLKETKDETWGQGLFDYNRMGFGLELEKRWQKTSGRAGVDYYTMNYPHYQSLVTENSFETSMDTTTYSEISAQAGTNVLNYNGIALFLESARQMSPKVIGTLRYDISMKNFVDQKTVQYTGAFSSTLRSDLSHTLSMGINLATPRVVLSLTDALQMYDSNQNTFDTASSEYVANNYDYFQNGIMPAITFKLGSVDEPVKLSLLWDISWRLYAERMAQDANGDNKSDKISQLINTMGMSISYPLAGALSGKVALNYSDSSSNMRYEKNYKYNYYTFNYFLGINWEL